MQKTIKLKPVHEQVIVITGASSGIGLATASMAAKRGARVVLAARDEKSLERGVRDIKSDGGEAFYVVADVTDREAIRNVVDRVISEYGGFDTWVNNAGAGLYGRIDEVPIEDARRLFETNFWGMVNGSLAALSHLKQKGGALINIGSIASDRALPLQGYYSASKEAVKGFTEAFRMELEKEAVPISVTLIKPSSIATRYTDHAMNYMEEEPRLPSPLYDPDVVARTILACAARPIRHITVGAGGRVFGTLGRLTPHLVDKVMETTLFSEQKDGSSARVNRQSNLYQPMPGSGYKRSETDRMLLKSSLFTRAMLHPFISVASVAIAGFSLAAFWSSKKH